MINEKKVRQYCVEDISTIENYDKAMTDMKRTWDCHHRLEIGSNGELISRKDLIDHGLYYDRPASELIFLTHEEHAKIHGYTKKANLGRKLNNEWRTNMSKSHKGIVKDAEWREKISNSLKGRIFTKEHRENISKSMIGKVGHPISNSSKVKISCSKIGRRWFNNGVEQVCRYECPEGFKEGRLKKNKPTLK